MGVSEKIKNTFKKAVNVVRCSTYYRILTDKEVRNNWIYLESRKCTDFASNIFHVAKELSKEEYKSFKVFVGYKKDKYEFIKTKLQESGLDEAVMVRHESKEYYECLALCKYFFTDFHLSHRYIKRKEQKIVSLWHGTPLKTLGKDCLTETQASVQRIFLLADYQVYPGTFMKEKMIDVYWLQNLYKGEILNTGYPRNSAFFNESKREDIRKELAIAGKRVIMYMPTFRGIAGVNRNKEQNETLLGFFREIDELLTDNDVFFIKLHNYNDAYIDCSEFKHIMKAPERYDNYELQNACDVLVTDYSSVFFDFAVSGRKIILFQYDLEEYLKERGVCIDMDELPFPRVTNTEDLVMEINRPKNYNDKEFLKKFANYDNENASKMLCEKVLFGKNPTGYTVEKLIPNGKKNVVIYCGPLEAEKEREEFWEMINGLDLDKANYYISYFEPVMYKHAERLACLPEKANLLGMWGRISFTLRECVAYFSATRLNIVSKKGKEKLRKHFKREMIKHYGHDVKPNTFVLWYAQDKDVVGLYENATGKKISTKKINGFNFVDRKELAQFLNSEAEQ